MSDTLFQYNEEGKLTPKYTTPKTVEPSKPDESGKYQRTSLDDAYGKREKKPVEKSTESYARAIGLPPGDPLAKQHLEQHFETPEQKKIRELQARVKELESSKTSN